MDKLKIVFTEEHKRNISNSLKGNTKLMGNQYWKKRNQSKSNEKIKVAMNRPEIKEKLRQAAIVQFSNPKNRKKISDALKGKTSNKKGKTFEEMYGVEKAAELKTIGRNKNLGKKYSDEINKKKATYGINNGMNKPGIKEKHLIAIRDSPVWKGGLSYGNYSIKFTKQLKNKIKKRDNHKCQICNGCETEFKTKLQVHHIDYNKKNSDEQNLISLCCKCHAVTNWNRKIWKRKLKVVIYEKYRKE